MRRTVSISSCNRKSRQYRDVCTGALISPVKIYSRAIKSPLMPISGSDVDYTEDFTLVASTYAHIETLTGVTIFDSVNVETDITHYFYIRKEVSLTSENWLEFAGRRFKIIRIDDTNENGRFYKLFCAERGDSTKDATRS